MAFLYLQSSEYLLKWHFLEMGYYLTFLFLKSLQFGEKLFKSDGTDTLMGSPK